MRAWASRAERRCHSSRAAVATTIVPAQPTTVRLAKTSRSMPGTRSSGMLTMTHSDTAAVAITARTGAVRTVDTVTTASANSSVSDRNGTPPVSRPATEPHADSPNAIAATCSGRVPVRYRRSTVPATSRPYTAPLGARTSQLRLSRASHSAQNR